MTLTDEQDPLLLLLLVLLHLPHSLPLYLLLLLFYFIACYLLPSSSPSSQPIFFLFCLSSPSLLFHSLPYPSHSFLLTSSRKSISSITLLRVMYLHDFPRPSLPQRGLPPFFSSRVILTQVALRASARYSEDARCIHLKS